MPPDPRPPALVERAVQTLTQALFGIACAALILMLVSYLAEVALRYAFNAPTRWASDVVSYALLVTISFALPVVTRDGGHVAITALVERLGQAPRQRMQRALAAVSALACAGGAALLALQAQAQWAGGIETVAALAVPKWWLSAAVAVGLLGSALQFALQARRAAG